MSVIQYVFIAIAIAAAFAGGCMASNMVHAYRNRQRFSQLLEKRWEAELALAGTKTSWFQHLRAIACGEWPSEGCLLIAVRNYYNQAQTLGIYDRFDFNEPLRLAEGIKPPPVHGGKVHSLAEARKTLR